MRNVFLLIFLAGAFFGSSNCLSADESGSLRVIFPDEKSLARPVYARSSHDLLRLTQNEFQMAGVEGGWVALQVGTLEGYFYVPYRGGSEWVIEVEGEAAWLKNGDRKTLLGVLLDKSNAADPESARTFFGGIDFSRSAEVFTVAMDKVDHLDWLDAIPADVRLALCYEEELTEERFAKLKSRKLVGLDLDKIPNPDFLQRLGELDTLEYLCVRLSNRDTKDLVLPAMPNLKHLVAYGGAQGVLWESTLRGLPNLESVVMRGGGKPNHSPQEVVKSLAANPKLRFLEVNCPGRIFAVKALADAPQLEYLQFNRDSIVESAEGLEALSSLRNLRSLAYSRFDLGQELLDRWAENGGLENVVQFDGLLIPPLEMTPNLALIHTASFDWQSEFPDWTRLRKAPASLRKVSVFGLSENELEHFAESLPDSVESLDLLWVKMSDAEQLYQFSGVRSLRVHGSYMLIPHLDLSRLEGIERFDIMSNPEVESIIGIPQHSTLRDVELKYLNKLKNLGEAAPNDRISFISLRGLRSLDSVAALEQTTGLRALRVEDLDALKSVEDLLEGNDSLVRVRVDKSKHLKNILRYNAR